MKRSLIALLHIGYWLIYTGLITLVMTLIGAGAHYHGKNFVFQEYAVLALLFAFIPGVLGFYTFYFLLFPRFLSKKKILPLILWGLVSTIAIAAFTELIAYFLIQSARWNVENCLGIGITLSLDIIPSGILGLVMRGFINWYNDIRLKEDLKQKNHDMEMALVKSQIAPHFLFNTINNIDVLILKDPVLASGYLNKLSDIMRFMLYESKSEKVPLTRELSYIEKYISLQKIRSDNPRYVKYSVSGDAGNAWIEPLLFIPFIENAFKYAVNKKAENAIIIHLNIAEDKITFECTNHYVNGLQVTPEHGGLGNELIVRRLDLLYGNRHTIEISDADQTYAVKLTLQRA